jgi:hypothetical protein
LFNDPYYTLETANLLKFFHEPERAGSSPQRPRSINCVSADVRRLILFGAKEVRASLRRLLRFMAPEQFQKEQEPADEPVRTLALPKMETVPLPEGGVVGD